jgi:hypothetical protein
MRKLLLTLALLASSYLHAGIYERNSGYVLGYQELVYDDFVLNLSSPKWQPRRYYYGIAPSSIGYFHVDNWDGNINVYGSNRYVLENNLEAFYQSLQPLEMNLLPYATPNAGDCISSRIISQETTSISHLPAKKIVFELKLPDQKEEVVVSYLFTKPKSGLFSDSVLGYTYSVSCSKKEYHAQRNLLDEVIKKLEIR